jgi:hypothetical protein
MPKKAFLVALGLGWPRFTLHLPARFFPVVVEMLAVSKSKRGPNRANFQHYVADQFPDHSGEATM